MLLGVLLDCQKLKKYICASSQKHKMNYQSLISNTDQESIDQNYNNCLAPLNHEMTGLVFKFQHSVYKNVLYEQQDKITMYFVENKTETMRMS
jgi:hypothetical protein